MSDDFTESSVSASFGSVVFDGSGEEDKSVVRIVSLSFSSCAWSISTSPSSLLSVSGSFFSAVLIPSFSSSFLIVELAGTVDSEASEILWRTWKTTKGGEREDAWREKLRNTNTTVRKETWR
jgi:hypothetical protein